MFNIKNRASSIQHPHEATMTDIEQIQTIRSQTLALLDALPADPNPTYWIDGQRVHWQEYADSLHRTIDWCDRKLAEYQPFEVR
jgi:hypothetical protein